MLAITGCEQSVLAVEMVRCKEVKSLNTVVTSGFLVAAEEITPAEILAVLLRLVSVTTSEEKLYMTVQSSHLSGDRSGVVSAAHYAQSQLHGVGLHGRLIVGRCHTLDDMEKSG